jgi:hypothetical protein
MAADDNVWVEQDVGGRPCYKNVTTNAVAWTLPEGGRLQRDTTQSPIVSGTVTVSGASVPLEMAGDGDEEAPAVVVSGKVITPAHPAIVAVRSLNSQHSLMTLHSHVSEEHAKHDEGKPQKVRPLQKTSFPPPSSVRKRTTLTLNERERERERE